MKKNIKYIEQILFVSLIMLIEDITVFLNKLKNKKKI